MYSLSFFRPWLNATGAGDARQGLYIYILYIYTIYIKYIYIYIYRGLVSLLRERRKTMCKGRGGRGARQQPGVICL